MPANPPIGLQRFIPSSEPQRAMVQSLMRQVRTLETAGRGGLEGRRISSGFEVIDRCLPQGGYLSGSLVEWLYEGAGNGGWWFALQAAKQAMEGGKYLVVLDPQRRFYPVAVASLGIPLDRMIVIQAKDEADLLWSLDQSLRNSSVGAVVASIEQFDDREARRLQLAAEQGGGLGLLLRPARRARGMPS